MQFFKNIFSKRHTTSLTVTSNNGFHLRPVAQFVAKAKESSYAITATFNGKTVNAKAVNTLLSLNLDKGDTFTLSIKSKEGEKTLKGLTHTFKMLMIDDVEEEAIEKKSQSYEGDVLEGQAIYEGIVIAPLVAYESKENYLKNNLSFDEAIKLSIKELDTLYETYKTSSDARIYLAQKELLLSHHHHGQSLELFTKGIQEASLALKGGKLESKIADYKDLLRRVKSHLGYTYEVTYPTTPFILLCDDLLPSEVATLEESEVQGVILQKTSSSSHSAILLRSAGIVSIIIQENVPRIHEDVILDTSSAVLVFSPSPKDINIAKETQRLESHQKEKSHAKRFHQAFTTSNTHISVYANVADLASAQSAKEEGAEGIGLLRSEFLFKTEEPSLEIQTKAYSEIFSLFNDITVRTLDVGGDKDLPYIQIPEEQNPFLGLRGVRLFDSHPEVLAVQLHAIFLAAKNKPIKIMFPMVSTVEEFNKAKAFAHEVAQKHQLDISNILFGIMIEVPSVLFHMDAFNQVVDFYSIGTNDLTQYLFATERTHPTLQTDELSPVVFSALKSIIQNATKPVSICGELASNKEAIAKLVTLGLHTLSVNPKSIAQTKEEIRHV